MQTNHRSLVNPVSLTGCQLITGDSTFGILDLSFLRAVTERSASALAVGTELAVMLKLDRQTLSATMVLQVEGDDFLRFGFSKLVPSGQACLRAFLSPRKVGESLIQDWNSEECRHFHGLNESELWAGLNGEVMFSYLDQSNTEFQFVLHISERFGIRAGKIPRKDYIALENMGDELPLKSAPSDRDTYLKLGECRDIITNLRPTTQVDYGLKARLLKAISDHLYSTSHKVEWTPIRPTRFSSPSVELS